MKRDPFLLATLVARLAWWRRPLPRLVCALLIVAGAVGEGVLMQQTHGWAPVWIVAAQAGFGLALLGARNTLVWWLIGFAGWLLLAGAGARALDETPAGWQTLWFALTMPVAWIMVGRARYWHLCLAWVVGMGGLALACLSLRDSQDVVGAALLATALTGVLVLGRAQALRGGALAWRPGWLVLAVWLVIGGAVGGSMHIVSNSEHHGYRIGDSEDLAQSDPSSNSSHPLFAVTALQTFGPHGVLRLDEDDARRIYGRAYWRGGVFYTLDGGKWYRPYAPIDVFTRAGNAYPRWVGEQPGRYLYRVTPLGEMAGRVWLDHVVSVNTLTTSLRKDSPAIQGSGEFTADGMWLGDPVFGEAWPRWRQRGGYVGAAVFNAPYPGAGFVPPGLPPAPPPSAHAPPATPPSGHPELPPFIRFGLGKSATRDNPRTVAIAERLAGGEPATAQPARFLAQWLTWLNQHTVYDTRRSAYGETRHVADAFLAGGHGTCVDFATSTVVALRAVGVPARYVTGFYGGQWNPWMNAWVVGGRDAHAWVEYFDASKGLWIRVDPTAAIMRVVRGVSHPHGWTMWLHAQLYGWRMRMPGAAHRSDGTNAASAALPPIPWNLLIVVAGVLGVLVGTLVLVRHQRQRNGVPWLLACGIRLVQWRARWRGKPWARQPWESLTAWTTRLEPLSLLPRRAASMTEDRLYGTGRRLGAWTWVRAALARWKR